MKLPPTPRTDAAIRKSRMVNPNRGLPTREKEWVSPEFARALERELSAALSRIDMQRDEFQRILAHKDHPTSVQMYAERAIKEIERTVPITVDCERLQRRCDGQDVELTALRDEVEKLRVLLSRCRAAGIMSGPLYTDVKDALAGKEAGR